MSAVSDKPPGDDGMTYNPWHRRVVPVFVLLLVVAGLMLGFVACYAPSAAFQAIGA
jgi:hypothetical protein